MAEKISLQGSNCNILGLATTVALFANEARFTQIQVFFRTCSLQNEVGDPPFFYISEIINSSSLNGKIFRKKSMLENFGVETFATVFLKSLQVQMTQAQMAQPQTPMSQGQVSQAQMQAQQQQQLSQSQSSFLPDNMSLLEMLQ